MVKATKLVKKPSGPTEKKPTAEDGPSPKHLSWVIEGRANNQRVALRLFEIFDRYQDQLKTRHFSAQDLVSVAFSLWRAVFLADRTGKMDLKDKQAKEFLAKMLTDNAIAYVQDRSAREWSFNYYTGNARFRLDKLGDRWRSVKDLLIPLSQKGVKSARGRWDTLHMAFEEAVHCLEADLEKNKTKADKKIK
jgi:ribosome-associated translation inhibitor RaiA